MLRRLPIRYKLIAALAVPMLTLASVAFYKTIETGRDLDRAEGQMAMATAVAGPDSFLRNLQHERNVASLWLLDIPPANVGITLETLEEAEPLTNESLDAFRELVESSDADVQGVYERSLQAIDGELTDEGLTSLEEVRAATRGFEGQRRPSNVEVAQQVFTQYSQLVDEIADANMRWAVAVDDSTLRDGAQLVDLINRREDVVARLAADMMAFTMASDDAAQGGLATTEEITTIAGFQSELSSNEADIRELAKGDYAPLVEEYLETEHVQRFPELVQEALDTGSPQIQDLLASSNVHEDELESGLNFTTFQQSVQDLLDDRSDSLRSTAQWQRLYYLSFVLLFLLLVGVIALWVSWSITRPLRALATQAAEMANDRLPDAVQDILETPLGEDVTVPHVEPVAVKTRDEVADVAHALNTVQDSALELAVEQAVLRRNIADSFVNLGRRNQSLLGRQLDFITELEQNETDPDTLANLFRLDHLATRMRRNAESLLVLAGIEPPRKWAAPVRLTDVIRAALGEVEDYQRVTVRAVEPATIMGSAAADLAHLLAELIENALIFSPPDQTVEIRGRAQPTGYTLAVIDSGLGMPQEEITRANRRLAGAESFTIAPSKYLGHYVAGNLAARHNIHIELDDSKNHNTKASGGTAATVHLPPTLLTTEEAPGEGEPLDHAPGAPQLREAEDPLPEQLPQPEAPQPEAPQLELPPPPPLPSAPGALPRRRPREPSAPAPAASATPPAPAQQGPPAGAGARGTSTSWQIPTGPAAVTAEQPVVDPLSAKPPPPGQQPPGPLPSEPPQRLSASGPPPSRTSGGLAKRTPGHNAGRIPTNRSAPAGAGSPTSAAAGEGGNHSAADKVADLPGRKPAPPNISEELLRTLTTYTDRLQQRHVSPAPRSPITPPRGSAAGFPSSAPTPPPGVPTLTSRHSRPDGEVQGAPPAEPAPTMHTSAPQHTSSGLTRRVRGAQMPTTEPVELKRSPDDGPARNVEQAATLSTQSDRGHSGDLSSVGAGISSGNIRRGSAAGDGMNAGSASRPARDVYNFLSSFTAGVQRGLDEANTGPTKEEDQ